MPTTTQQVDTNAGLIDNNIHIFEPKETSTIVGTIVTVHPWATLGGSEHNTIGLARHIINSKLKDDTGWRVITFNMQSTPILKGGILGGVLCAHAYEVQQIIAVVNWVSKTYGKDHNIILLGLSAGAPQSGSALAQLEQEKNVNISAYIAVGYTFGKLASIGFYRHFHSIVTASSPKLFISGDRDEFTSVNQLEDMVKKMRSNSHVDTEIVANVGHFELESPGYDALVAQLVLEWLDKVVIA